MKAADSTDDLRRKHAVLEPGDDDKKAGEHQQQSPVDFGIDLLGFDPPSEQQKGAGDDRGFGGRNARKETRDHGERDRHRLDNDRPVGMRRLRLAAQLVTRPEFGAVNKRDQTRTEHQPEPGNRRERSGESAVGNMRQTRDDHVLRITADCRGAAGIRRHRDCEHVRDRVAPQTGHEIEDERRQDQANRIVH
jgi:hypothetical protein